jgi:hypothetical protein
MTLKPDADGELPVGAFMGEAPWQSQPMEGVRALFRSDWIGTEALFLILTRFSSPEPVSTPDQVRGRLSLENASVGPLGPKLPLYGTRETSL